jgi:hypothetical protein
VPNAAIALEGETLQNGFARYTSTDVLQEDFLGCTIKGDFKEGSDGLDACLS